MSEFLMIFRTEKSDAPKPSPEQMQAMIKQWQDWIGGIAAQGKFLGTNALSSKGKTIHNGRIISDGPYAEVKEIIGGYLLCKADDMDDALNLAGGCPTFDMGGKVEVREVTKYDM